MIDDSYKRIAGIHVVDDGTIAAVWMARDPDTDVIHLYDASVFDREVLAVIAEGLSARGRWIPIAWTNEEVAGSLKERGCTMVREASDSSDAMAEMASRDILERMRTGRFKVDRRLNNWLEELKTFNHEDSRVPKDSHPLMAATRHAMLALKFARSQALQRATTQTKNYPKLALV